MGKIIRRGRGSLIGKDRGVITAEKIELTRREKVFPEKIKIARKLLDLTQGELADKLKCSRVTVSMWESNVTKILPTRTNLEKLADLLDVPLELLDDEDINAEALWTICKDKEIDKKLEADANFMTKYCNGEFDHPLPKNYSVDVQVLRDKKTGEVIKGAKHFDLRINDEIKIIDFGKQPFPIDAFRKWREQRNKSKRYQKLRDAMQLYKDGSVKRFTELLDKSELLHDKRIKHGRHIKSHEKISSNSGLEALLPLVDRKIIGDEDSYSRVAIERANAAKSYNFWPGVGMLCEEQVPQFQERYGGAFVWDQYSMEFDFCCERTGCVARYATLHKHNEIDLMKAEIERMCGQLLVMEKMYGKKLNKYILIYDRESRHEPLSKFQEFGPPKWMAQLTQSCKISVLFFSKSKEAVETLLNLVDHK